MSMVIPCHRVIGHDGELIGYGGGLAVKKRLLQLEQAAGQMSLDFNGQSTFRYAKVSARRSCHSDSFWTSR